VESTVGPGQADPINALFEHYGPLTMLETFYAVASVDLQPNELLVRSHSSETEALGRASDAVLEASLDAIDIELQDSQLVEKSLPANALQTCKNSILVNNATMVWTRAAAVVASAFGLGFDSFLCAGGENGIFIPPGSNDCGALFFRQPLRVGICHLDPSSPATAFAFGASFQGSKMSWGTSQVLSSGQSKGITFVASASLKRAGVLRFSPPGTSSYVLATGVAETP
jgi:hypothetical protein